ncbi:MAG: DNA replication/repair protein RecF [Acidimicrobiales bacterium]
MHRLSIKEFRNLAEVDLHPAPGGLTVIQGENGAGKTSLLEALSYCSVLKSFRKVHKDSLLRNDAQSSLITCDLLQGSRRVEIEVHLESGRRDQVTVNKQRVSGAKELVAVLRTTLFTPDDLELVKGSPGGRRDLLDDAILATSPRMAAERTSLERILRQRNALLRQLNGRLPADAVLTLDIWDERLAVTGEKVAEAREQLVDALVPYASAAWSALAPNAGAFELRYLRSFSGRLADVIAAQRHEDLRRQVTTVGPQRDELEITAGGLDARTRLSQGRQRCVALALRLGVHRYVSDVTGAVPVLLLDDAFSELDDRTARALVTELPSGQALLTTAGALPPGASPELVVNIVEGRLVA